MKKFYFHLYWIEELKRHVLNAIFKGKVSQILKDSIVMMAVILYLTMTVLGLIWFLSSYGWFNYIYFPHSTQPYPKVKTILDYL